MTASTTLTGFDLDGLGPSGLSALDRRSEFGDVEMRGRKKGDGIETAAEIER